MYISNAFFKAFALIIVVTFSLKCALCEKPSDSEVTQKISEFRFIMQPRIFPNSSLVHGFILDNDYVLQWLKENYFNVESATKHLMEHLNWRNKESIDQIHLENWEFYRVEYPQFINLSNKTSDLIAEVWLSDWNLRAAVMSGRSKKLLRWAVYLAEMSQRKFSKIRMEARKTNSSYKSVEIIDIGGFNAWQHGCISCVNTITAIGQLCEYQYPGLWNNVYMINAGSIFRQFLTTLGRAFRTLSTGVLKIYTTKHEWMPLLNREISKDQRSNRFGGILKRTLEHIM